MSLLSKRINRIKPSPTLALTRRASELKAEGKDILSLGAGEPDFGTPQWVKEAGIKAFQEEKTKYTLVPGTVALRKAVQAKFQRENNISYELDEIIVGVGGKQIIFNALMATLNEGDEVLIPAPYWVSYPDMTLVADGVPVIIECPEATGFKLTPELLEAAITPRTKWLILNSPSNPTGAVYTNEDLSKLATVLEKYPHVYILSDDIYEHVLYQETPFETLAGVAPALKNRTLTMNGVSKAYAMTGLRIGYAGGPKELISAMGKLQSQSTSNPCSVSQEAALAALEGPQEFLKERRDSFKQRRDQVVEGLNKIEGITCLKPEGAFYVYPSCAALLGKMTPQGQTLQTDSDVCDYFLNEVGVAVVPGSAFGLAPYFRISYATDLTTLQDALTRLEKAVNLLT